MNETAAAKAAGASSRPVFAAGLGPAPPPEGPVATVPQLRIHRSGLFPQLHGERGHAELPSPPPPPNHPLNLPASPGSRSVPEPHETQGTDGMGLAMG